MHKAYLYKLHHQTKCFWRCTKPMNRDRTKKTLIQKLIIHKVTNKNKAQSESHTQFTVLTVVKLLCRYGIPHISQIEPNGKLKIQLYGCTLMRSPKSIQYGDVNLWAIKGTISRILFPFHSKIIQTFCQLL